MDIVTKEITLPDGLATAEFFVFDKKDKEILIDIYKKWVALSDELESIGARRVNLPEGLSEVAFCVQMNCWRKKNVKGAVNKSWDCYNPVDNTRIQVKSSSTGEDLTSFGPNSVWDEIYFQDFYREGKWDGSFDIYKIDSDLIYNHKVNKNQTLKDQQEQGRRPRFSIMKDLIKPLEIKPVVTGHLWCP